MLYKREDQARLEAQSLAPYALTSQATKGRRHSEQESLYRTAFQRDRDRILHTTAFRRLEYKTQVFVNFEGDHYRTRLTHTLEVAQVGRSLARALGANEDLVETIALGHDLGHPPFGHAGEHILNKLMAEHGGFEHNFQSYRILTKLEKRYPDWEGLNLTFETLEGVIKHETEYDKAKGIADFDSALRASLEAQIANLADEIAYNAHDLDDGLRAGLINVEQLVTLELWERVCEGVTWKGGTFTDIDRHEAIRELMGLQINDVLTHTENQLQHYQPQTPQAIQQLPHNIVGHTPDMAVLIRQWKNFLYENMYRHYRVARMSRKAERFLSGLFEEFIREPAQLPPTTQAKVEKAGLHRAVTDYIAGMTDRYALQEWERLFSPFERP